MTASNDPARRPDGEAAGRPDAPETGRRAAPADDGSRDARPTAPAGDAPTGRRAADRPVDEREERTAQETTGRAGTGRTEETEPAETRRPVEEEPVSRGGKTAGLWISLILGAIVLVLLLIFVLQNNQTAGFRYFSTEFDLPLGIAMLLAAIAGALVMALVGSVRMIQMGWTIRRLRKQQERIHRATR